MFVWTFALFEASVFPTLFKDEILKTISSEWSLPSQMGCPAKQFERNAILGWGLRVWWTVSSSKKHQILLFTKILKSTLKLEKYFFLQEINYKFFETCILNKNKYFINNFTTLIIKNQRNYDAKLYIISYKNKSFIK